MMCENPKDLVKKYGRYLHGDPEHNHPEKRVDRKIVLDSEMLPAMESAGHIRVLSPQHLLQRFLDTLRSESKLAKKNGETLLILIFGHGDMNSYSIAVGGKTSRDAPRLTRVDFHNHLQPDVEATLIVTSCYSGGWLTQPRAGTYYEGTAPLFNMTGIAGAGNTRKSRSLPNSASIGRQAAGSYLVKSIINGLMAVSDAVQPPNSPSPDLTVETMMARVTVDDDGEHITDSPTYAALVKAVHDELVHVVDPFNWDYHKFSFAAQDDLWETDWRKRTGLPLIKYRERWDQLRSVPTGSVVMGGGGQTLLPQPAQYQTGGSPGLSARQRGILMAKAICYMNSNPGDAAIPATMISRHSSRASNSTTTKMSCISAMSSTTGPSSCKRLLRFTPSAWDFLLPSQLASTPWHGSGNRQPGLTSKSVMTPFRRRRINPQSYF